MDNGVGKSYRDVAWHIYDCLRSEGLREESQSRVIAIATLAMMLKSNMEMSIVMTKIGDGIGDETTLVFLHKVAREHGNQIKDIAERFDVEDLKAVVLLSEPQRFTEVDEHATPLGVSKLAIALLDLNSDDTILDLGSGVGSFLIQAAEASKSQCLYGVEINTESVIVANIRRFVLGHPIKVIQGNMVSQEYSFLSANKVFSDHPLGMRFASLDTYVRENPLLRPYFVDAKQTVSGDWIFNLAAYLNTKQPGKTVVLMTNAGTWNKPDEELREWLVREGAIEGVILLPERLFSRTAISLTLMILSQGNQEIRMVDASDMFTAGRRQNSLEAGDIERILDAYHKDTCVSRKVSVDEIVGNEYILNPRRYIEGKAGVAHGIPLGQLCRSINRGAMIKSNELDELASPEETKYRYLMLQNIAEGVVDADLPSLSRIDDKYRKYCIGDKNLVISKISPFKVATVHVNEDELILANGNLYFIELDETKVNPLFVEVFLQSEAGMAQLNRLAKGSAIQSISIQDLKTVQVPDIPREQQDRIATEYESLCDELVVLQRQSDIVRDKKARLIEEVIS